MNALRLALFASFLVSAAAEDTKVAHFEESVLPLMQEHCFKCHSHETKIKGGLVLDSRIAASFPTTSAV